MTQRIWRTDDGRHVPDGHPDASFLAYGPGDAVPKAVLDEIEGKAQSAPADKEQPVVEDKGGLTVETKASLTREIEDLGGEVDKRWGLDRLRTERDQIKAAKTESTEEE